MDNVPTTHWTTCRACNADIVYAQTNKREAGRPVQMPVDVRPSTTGNVFLSLEGGQLHAGVVGKNQAAGMRDAGQTLHLSHFATCPQAARFRKLHGGPR